MLLNRPLIVFVQLGGVVFFDEAVSPFPLGGGGSFLSAPLTTKITKSNPIRTNTMITILVVLMRNSTPPNELEDQWPLGANARIKL